MHHTKLQINGPSGHCSHLDFHPPPEVQQPSPVNDLFKIMLNMNEEVFRCNSICNIVQFCHSLTLFKSDGSEDIMTKQGDDKQSEDMITSRSEDMINNQRT